MDDDSELRRATKLIVAWEGEDRRPAAASGAGAGLGVAAGTAEAEVARWLVGEEASGAKAVAGNASSPSPSPSPSSEMNTPLTQTNPIPSSSPPPPRLTEPVGFVAYVAGSMEFSITKVAVAPRARRRGLGEAMTRAAVAAARRRGARVVRLRVETTGRAALALYRKIGFAEEGDRRGPRPLTSLTHSFTHSFPPQWQASPRLLLFQKRLSRPTCSGAAS